MSALTLGYLLGIRVRINTFFLVALALYAALGLLPSVLVYFFLIVTHELAHVVFAAGLGLRIEEIEVLPFGSVARIPELDRAAPSVETTVALAGPLHNFLFLAIGLMVERHFGGSSTMLLETFIQGNLALGLFNMVPVLPLDGGRVARAQLAPRLGYAQATKLLVAWGQNTGAGAALFAVVLALAQGVLLPGLAVLGVFIYYAAAREGRNIGYSPVYQVLRKQGRLGQGQVLTARHIVVGPDLSLGKLLPELLADYYHLIWVVDPTRGLLGYIPESELVESLQSVDIDLTVGELLEIM